MQRAHRAPPRAPAATRAAAAGRSRGGARCARVRTARGLHGRRKRCTTPPRDDTHASLVDRARRRPGRLVRRAAVRRVADLPAGAADPRARRIERRHGRVHARRGRRRRGRVAVARRHGARLGVGPRLVRRAGLDRRLAAPRARRRARRLGAARARRALRRPDARAAGRAARAPARALSHEHLRRRDRHDLRCRPSARPRSSATVAYYTALFRDGKADYALPAGSITERAARARSVGVLLLVGVGRGDRSPRRYRHVHEQLAARAADRQPADVRRDRVDRRQHHRAARRHRRDRVLARAPPRRRAARGGARGDPLLGTSPTPSQRATIKYFWVVCALLVLQIVVGIITAHYGVEGDGLYGIPLAKFLPYSVARTWHLQLGIFWIATAWLAAGPRDRAVGRRTSRSGQRAARQRAVLARWSSSSAGRSPASSLAIHGKLSDDGTWWFGHSGYEYIDLGRIFQIALLVGPLPVGRSSSRARCGRRSSAPARSGR